MTSSNEQLPLLNNKHNRTKIDKKTEIRTDKKFLSLFYLYFKPA